MEVSSKPQEAIAYCQKATSVCKARLHRLTNEVKSCSDLTSASELAQDVPACPKSESNNSILDKQSEIETLKGLSSELEKKVDFVNFVKTTICPVLCCYFDLNGNLWGCSLKICNS